MQTFIYACVLQAALLGGEPKLKAVSSATPAKAHPGDKVDLQIECEILAGWHIYPPEFKGTGIPTTLEIKPGLLSPAGKLAFPEPLKGRDEDLKEDFTYFEGKVQFTQPLLISKTASPGKTKVEGTLGFQACSKSQCVQGTAPIEAEVEVLAADGPPPASPVSEVPDLAPKVSDAPKQAKPEVAIRLDVQPARLAPGGEGELIVRYTVPSGFHIYATDHKAQTGIPTRIVLDEKFARTSGAPVMKPAPKPKRFFEERHRILEKEGEIRVRFALEKLPPGAAKLPVSVTYQLCDESTCRDGEFKGSVEIEVVEGKAPGEAVAPPRKGPGEEKALAGAKTAFNASLEPPHPTPGEKATLVIGYEVPAGARLHALDEGAGLATRIEVDPRFASIDGAPASSPAKTIKVDGQDRRVLEGAGEIRVPIVINKDAPPEGGVLAVSVFHSSAPGAVEEDRLTLNLKFSFGWLAFILLAIGAGAVSVLMPCTYPMIPITISYFTRQAAAQKASAVSLALAYGLGIVGSFTIIGVIGGFAGGGIVQLFNAWWVNAGVALLFVVFGISLLGLFELRLPASLNHLASRASGGTGFAGVLLLGATLVITSFACTGPFIGGVILGGALGNGVPGAVAGMFFFGLTMAVPFVGLALAPGMVKSLPKSGGWLHTLKVSLGFVVLATALPFISKVDKTLQWQALPRELYLLILTGITLALAVYLFGMIRLHGDSSEIGPARLIIALLVLLFGLYFFYGSEGNPLAGAVETFVPDYSAARAGGAPGQARNAESWTVVVDDFEGGLAKAKAEGKRAFINWTGVNCTNCKAMERTVFTKPEVIRELEKYVELRLHVDRPDPVSKDLEKIKEERSGGDVTVPLYEIVDPETRKTVDVFKGADLPGGQNFRDFLARNAKK